MPILPNRTSASQFFAKRIDNLRVPSSFNSDAQPATITPAVRRSAVLLLFGAAVVTTVALFPSYYEGGPSLSRSGQNLAFNIPIIVGMLIASGLIETRRRWPTGAGVATAVVLVEFLYLITDVVAVTTGATKPGIGFVLGGLGWLLAAAGTILTTRSLIRAGGFQYESGPVTATWALVGMIVSTLWAVGYWLPDAGYHLHLTSGTFNGTGTARITSTCCDILLDHPHADAVVQAILLIASAFSLPLLATLILLRGFGNGLFIGTSVTLSAEWFSSVFASSAIAPANFGWTTANASQHGFTASWFPTIGFIMLGLGTLGFFLLAVSRLLLRR